MLCFLHKRSSQIQNWSFPTTPQFVIILLFPPARQIIDFPLPFSCVSQSSSSSSLLLGCWVGPQKNRSSWQVPVPARECQQRPAVRGRGRIKMCDYFRHFIVFCIAASQSAPSELVSFAETRAQTPGLQNLLWPVYGTIRVVLKRKSVLKVCKYSNLQPHAKRSGAEKKCIKLRWPPKKETKGGEGVH